MQDTCYGSCVPCLFLTTSAILAPRCDGGYKLQLNDGTPERGMVFTVIKRNSNCPRVQNFLPITTRFTHVFPAKCLFFTLFFLTLDGASPSKGTSSRSNVHRFTSHSSQDSYARRLGNVTSFPASFLHIPSAQLIAGCGHLVRK
jgi:hypothetical protein